MSADNDGDSQMVSSGEDSDPEVNRDQTPAGQTTSSSFLSPPDSQSRSAMPTAAPGSTLANANGKRPLNTISNGADDVEELVAMANGKARQDFPVRTHQASGYSWSRADEEPGYHWMNKKAVDEYHRAVDSMVHRDSMVKGMFMI